MSTLVTMEPSWPIPAALPHPEPIPEADPTLVVPEETEEPEVFPDLWCCHAFEGEEARGFIPE